jgi:hypothetical protein
VSESTKTPLIALSFSTSATSSVQVAIWENEQEKNGEHFTTHSCTLQRRYRDGNEWKSTQSFRASELLMMSSFASQEAYRRLMEEKQKS